MSTHALDRHQGAADPYEARYGSEPFVRLATHASSDNTADGRRLETRPAMSDRAPSFDAHVSDPSRSEHGHSPTDIQARLARPARTIHLRDAVYGGIDGAVTTLAIVAGVAGAGLPHGVVVALGTANVLADGFSMAASNFVALRAERDNVQRLRAMEQRHVRDYPDGERRELRAILEAKGMRGATRDHAIDAICRSDRLWIDLMLLEEHGVAPTRVRPLSAALVTFVAFIACGLVPLGPFLLNLPKPFLISVVATGVMFGLIGSVRGRFSLTSSWRTALETMAIGSIAGLVAWSASAWVGSVGG